MTVNELDKQIKSQKIKPLYLFHGEEDYLINQKLINIKKAVLDPVFEDFNYFVFEGKNINVNEATDAVEGYPQMAEKKLVVFKNTEILSGAKSSLTDFFQKIIKSIPDFTHVVFVESKVDKRKAGLMKQIEGIGGIAAFPFLKPNQLEIWLESLFESAKKRVLTSDVGYIVSVCPPSMAILKNEFDKIINYAGTREKITREDIDAVVSKSVELKVFNLIDDIVCARTKNIFVSLKEMKESKEPAALILSLILSRISDVLMVINLTGDGFKFQDIKQFFEPNKQFLVSKSLEQSHRFSAEFLRYILEKGTEYDYAIKTGKINDYIAVEMLVIDIIRQTNTNLNMA